MKKLVVVLAVAVVGLLVVVSQGSGTKHSGLRVNDSTPDLGATQQFVADYLQSIQSGDEGRAHLCSDCLYPDETGGLVRQGTGPALEVSLPSLVRQLHNTESRPTLTPEAGYPKAGYPAWQSLMAEIVTFPTGIQNRVLVTVVATERGFRVVDLHYGAHYLTSPTEQECVTIGVLEPTDIDKAKHCHTALAGDSPQTTPTTLPPSSTFVAHLTDADGYRYTVTATDVKVEVDKLNAKPGQVGIWVSGSFTITNDTDRNAPYYKPLIGAVWKGSEEGASCSGLGCECPSKYCLKSSDALDAIRDVQAHLMLASGESKSYTTGDGFYAEKLMVPESQANTQPLALWVGMQTQYGSTARQTFSLSGGTPDTEVATFVSCVSRTSSSSGCQPR